MKYNYRGYEIVTTEVDLGTDHDDFLRELGETDAKHWEATVDGKNYSGPSDTEAEAIAQARDKIDSLVDDEL